MLSRISLPQSSDVVVVKPNVVGDVHLGSKSAIRDWPIDTAAPRLFNERGRYSMCAKKLKPLSQARHWRADISRIRRRGEKPGPASLQPSRKGCEITAGRPASQSRLSSAVGV